MIATRSSSEKRQWIAALIGNFAIFIMGMFLGWSSPVIKKLQSTDSNIPLTDEQVSWMVSLVYLGSIVSPLPTGIIIDRYGRKIGMYMSAGLAICSWIILLTTSSASGLYASRTLGGMVAGSGITVAPIYVSEIAEPKLRGGMNAVFFILMFSGIEFEYIVGPAVSYELLNIISLSVVIVLTVLLLIIPESPYYYTMVGNKMAAAKSLTWLRYSETESRVDSELNYIEKTVAEKMKNKKGISDLIKSKANRRALFMAETLAIIQRSSGISVIMAYASSAAPSSWVLTNDQCAILIGLTWIVFSLVFTKLVDRLGRRALLIISCLGCTVALGSFGTFNYVEENTSIDLSEYYWIQFAALVLYSVCYPIGLGSVPIIIQGEVFPANVKGIASGITTATLAITSFISNKIYQPIEAEYGNYVNYWMFATSCVIGLFFAFFVLIETKGKTLLEIQNCLRGKSLK